MEKAGSEGDAGEAEGPDDELDDGWTEEWEPGEGWVGKMESDVGGGVIRMEGNGTVGAGHGAGDGDRLEEHDEPEENAEHAERSAADLYGEGL